MPLVPLATQSRPGSEAYSGERLVNYFARQTDGVAPLVLLSRGGLVQFVNLGARVRALTSMGGSLYAVADATVWKITGGVASNVGTVTDGPTEIAASSSQVAIAVGGVYYVCDGSTTSSYSTGALTSVSGVAFIDGYFVLIGSSGGRADALTVSSLDNGTTFNALDFAFAEESPDALVAVLRDKDQLWLFGTDTVQLFYNAGAADFPFQPISGAILEHGCQARTAAKGANLVYWVKPNGTVMAATGADPQAISTPEIKQALSGATILRAFCFHERGHEFYAVVRETGTSLVYDMTTGLWAERSSGLDDGPWLAECSTLLDGTDYLGCAAGQVATMSDTTYTDFGSVMIGEVVTQPIQQGADRFGIQRLHVDFSGGSVDIGRTPQVVMQTSRDGRTWGAERWRDLADLGDYYKRAAWHGLGQFRRLNARFRITDEVPRDLIGGQFE